MLLQIDHSTRYRYREPVGLTPHVLRLVPRAAPGLHLLRSELEISPEAIVRWNLDLEENILGIATFPKETDHLEIKSTLVIQQRITNPFDFLLDERALRLPFSYNERERSLLRPYQREENSAPDTVLTDWLRPFLGGESPFSLKTLTAINGQIPALFRYTPRHEPGVRPVSATLAMGEGTCRDFAHLMMESSRALGVAARYVSGYLCSSPGTPVEESHTHGWCELYLPGAGWRGFDPTNGILAGAHHVAVATSVLAGEIPPIEGNYCGAPGLCLSHEVMITARELLPAEEEALRP